MFSWENKPATLSFLTDINDRVQAEEALKESEERYRSLVDNVPVAVYRATPGPKGKYLMANPTFLKLFGLESEEELKELSVADVYMNPEDRKAFSDELLAKGSVDRVELPLKKKDGTPFWGSVTARVVYDEGGKTYLFDCTIMDITARKQAEETLRESEERFREMADLLPTIIGELDLDSQLTYTNKAGLKTFGYSQEDLEAGLNVVDMVHPDDRERALKNMKTVIKRRQLSENEYRMLRKDGSELAVLLHSGPIYKSGKVIGIRSTLTDITQTKRTEKALRESEERYRSLFENANDAIFIAETNTHIILDANREAEKLIGRPREEIIGMHQSELHPPHDAELYREKFRNHVEKGSVFDLEAEVIKKDGGIVPVFISSSVITIHGKELIQGLFTDISKEKMIIDLREEIAAMKLIEKAKGVLMDRHNITEEEAIRRLQKESRRQRKKIKEIAQSVVSSELILK
jgi:PAS domain S-box-containing protein